MFVFKIQHIKLDSLSFPYSGIFSAHQFSFIIIVNAAMAERKFNSILRYICNALFVVFIRCESQITVFHVLSRRIQFNISFFMAHFLRLPNFLQWNGLFVLQLNGKFASFGFRLKLHARTGAIFQWIKTFRPLQRSFLKPS